MIPNEWRKARDCNGASACVEVAELANGNVALRDSKEPDGPVLVFTPSEWAAFTAGVRDGEFDTDALESPAVISAVLASGGEAPGRPPATPLTRFEVDSAPV